LRVAGEPDAAKSLAAASAESYEHAMTAGKQGERAAGRRAERLAAALKANLKRRKVQARGRAAAGEEPADHRPATTSSDAAPGRKGDRER